jgi:Putative amidase domain
MRVQERAPVPLDFKDAHPIMDNGRQDPEHEIGDPTPLPEPEFHPGDSEEEEVESKAPQFDLAAVEDAEKLCPTTLRCGRYDGHAAAEYVHRWVFAGENNQYVAEHHNKAFKYFGEAGGDCTNFASQALHAGGMKFLKTEGHNNPHEWPNDEELLPNPAYHRGTGSWWSGYWLQYLGAGETRREYKVTEAWDQARTLYRHLIETGLAREYSQGEQIHEGDLLFFDLYRGDDTEHIDHTDIVSSVLPTGAAGKGYVYLSQHSSAKTVTMAEEFKHVRDAYGQRGKDWEVYFVHPVYTEGNINEMSLK